jgi:hypothetical protein
MIQQLAPYSFYIELIFTLIVTISCAIIFFKTRELSNISSYKGILYFRNTFLFFAIAFCARFFARLVIIILPPPTRNFVPLIQEFIKPVQFIVIYASTVAIIYLIYSIYHKKINQYIVNRTYIIHLIAILIAIFSFITNNRLIAIVIQMLLFITFGIISFQKYTTTKKQNAHLYLIYLAIFGLWVISNFLEILSFFTPLIALIVYFVSIIIFLEILYKVLKTIH